MLVNWGTPREHDGSCSKKYVSDLVDRSPRKELVIKDMKCYRAPVGLGSFLLLFLATRRLLKETNSPNSDDKVF